MAWAYVKLQRWERPISRIDYEREKMYMKKAAGGKERDERQRIGRRTADGFGEWRGEESLADRLQLAVDPITRYSRTG